MTGFFILKRGLYYRPNSCGYTSNPREAGVYSEQEAKEHIKNCSELYMEPISQHFPKGKPKTYAELEDEIASLSAKIVAAEASC